MLTETEARSKWCPLSQEAPHGARAPRNRIEGISNDDAFPATCLCLASNCMAWRAERELIDPNTGKPAKQPLMRAEYRSTGRGWCGLAGKPP